MNNDTGGNGMAMASLTQASVVSASAWIKGISLSVLASMIGGASKLAIRKSWLMEQQQQHQQNQDRPLTAVAEATIDAVVVVSNTRSNNSNDSDATAIRYSQIENHAESDYCQPNMLNDDMMPAVQEDHYYGSHRHSRIHISPNRIFPVLLRICGMIGMTTLNPLCSVLAMNYASPSILAPFAGLTLVWIVLFSEALVGEQPTIRQVIAAALIVVGEVVIAIFGDHTNDEGISVDEVVRSYHETSFICFIVAMCIWMIFLLHYMCSPANAVNASSTVQRFAWGVAGGSITGFQNFLKDSLTILKASKGNNQNGSNNEFPLLLFMFMFGMAIFTAFSGLIILTLCMKRYDVTYSASMFVGSFCISASIMSAIHYDTFSHLNDIINYIGYPTGLLILLYGVYMLLMSTPAIGAGSNESSSQSNPTSTALVDNFRHTEGGEIS